MECRQSCRFNSVIYLKNHIKTKVTTTSTVHISRFLWIPIHQSISERICKNIAVKFLWLKLDCMCLPSTHNSNSERVTDSCQSKAQGLVQFTFVALNGSQRLSFTAGLGWLAGVRRIAFIHFYHIRILAFKGISVGGFWQIQLDIPVHAKNCCLADRPIRNGEACWFKQ